MNETTTDLNLETHRAAASVWDRRGWNGGGQGIALSRLLIGAGGVALAIQGARQRSWAGRFLAGIGSTAAWWALTGEQDFVSARRCVSDFFARATRDDDDPVFQASAESFPASDAPSFTPAVGTAAPQRHVPH